MSTFKIKLYGLSDMDKSSLTSMLNLAKKQLSHNWIIVTDGAADLSIYSFDSEEGQLAWQRHGDGISALLSINETPNEAVDFVLKKPLRSKNFSTALNTLASNLEPGKKNTATTPNPAENQAEKTKPKPKSTSLLSSLSKHFTTQHKPAKELPALTFSLPDVDVSEPDTILKPKQLQSWLSELAGKDIDFVISAILGNLLPLNRTAIASHKRLMLLELYRQPIHNLLFERDPRYIGQNLASHTDYLQAIHALNLLIKELSIGYQIIVNECYQQGDRPQSNTLYLGAINRLAFTTSLAILHAYHYYLSPPAGAIACLHQLYIYCEASNTLHAAVKSKEASSPQPFSHIYNQIMLTIIADPYRFPQDKIVALHTLMEHYADNITISPLTLASDDQLTSGHFYLDCSSDNPPASLLNISVEKRQTSSARLLDTAPVLKALERDLNPESTIVIQHERNTANIPFLKKVTPQLNATYERQFERIPSVANHTLHLALGIAMITHGLNNHDTRQFTQWTIHNKGMGGMMVSSHDMDCFQLNIGDFIGIFESSETPSIAIIRWLHTEQGSTRMGLERFSGIPIAITVTTDKPDVFSGLLLSNAKSNHLENTLIVDQPIFHTNRQLHINESDKTYVITADKLIEQSAFYEQFSFKLKAGA